MSIYLAIGRRIKELREEMKLTQADFGAILTRPRSHAAISDIERGKTKPDLDDLSDIAYNLGIGLNRLLEVVPLDKPVDAQKHWQDAVLQALDLLHADLCEIDEKLFNATEK